MSTEQFTHWAADDRGFLSTILTTTVFKSVLQGFLIAATYRYYTRTCSQDGPRLKTFVGAIMVLEIFHTAIAATKMYLVGIEHVFWRTYWLNPVDTTLNGTICLMSQIFFAHRCWRVTHRSTSVLYVLLVSIFILFAGDVAIIVNEWLAFREVVNNTAVLQGLVTTWGFSAALFELLVTTILFRFLWESRTGIRGLDKVILRLFTISFESSFPCLVFVLLLNLTVLLKSVSANFFAYSTASLYGLSLMVSLNCRERVQDSLVQFRRDGACLDFDTQPAPMTESQLFSEAGNTSRRGSTAVVSDMQHQFRRPSIMSFVKEVM